MKIMYLGQESRISNFLQQSGHELIHIVDKISPKKVNQLRPDFSISYGYRHILDKNTLLALNYHIINLHISYLPYNRGAHPNLWSVLEGTPSGVTIHYIDEGIDTGDIILQKKVNFSKKLTLEESYLILKAEIESLFIENFESILGQTMPRKTQSKESGSYHTLKQSKELIKQLKNGWSTSIEEVQSLREALK